MAADVAVKAQGLTKTYGEGETEVHALTDVTFEIPRGEFVLLAMTLILASWGMVDTMLLAIDRHFNEIALEDASVV